MSEAGIIDFAGLEDAAAAATVETTVDAPETTTEVINTTDGGDVTEEVEGEQAVDSEKNEDGTPKTTPAAGGDTTPQAIRGLLKQIKDADPKNAAAVKELHGSYERHQAYKKVYPTVQAAQEAKTFIEQTVGGIEGFEKLQNIASEVESTDALLHEGDPKVLENIVADLKEAGKIDALGKLAPAFLETLRKEDPDAYYATFSPLFLAGVEQVKLPAVMTGVSSLLDKLLVKSADGKTETVDVKVLDTVKEAIKNVSNWYDGLKAETETKKNDKVSPEMEKLNKEKEKFLNQQKEFETSKTKAFQTEVASECEKYDNRTLGTALKPFLKMPFFKGFPRETLVDLGQGIKARLHNTLKADKAYQTQMNTMWKAKSPDKAKITAYHNAKLDSIAEDIVRQTIQLKYPGYAKGGMAAGRVAAADAKKTNDKKAADNSVASGKPIYVATKPKWDAIDFDKDPGQLLYIAGKAYLKGGKFVTWRK